MSGRHIMPDLDNRTDEQWDAHVRSTRTAALIVGLLALAFLGAGIALTLHKFGVF